MWPRGARQRARHARARAAPHSARAAPTPPPPLPTPPARAEVLLAWKSPLPGSQSAGGHERPGRLPQRLGARARVSSHARTRARCDRRKEVAPEGAHAMRRRRAAAAPSRAVSGVRPPRAGGRVGSRSERSQAARGARRSAWRLGCPARSARLARAAPDPPPSSASQSWARAQVRRTSAARWLRA